MFTTCPPPTRPTTASRPARTVAFGIFLRTCTAGRPHGMVGVVFLQCAGSSSPARTEAAEFNWVLAYSCSGDAVHKLHGYLCLGTIAFWAITVGTRSRATRRWWDSRCATCCWATPAVGRSASLRFYVLHVAVLPLIMTL